MIEERTFSYHQTSGRSGHGRYRENRCKVALYAGKYPLHAMHTQRMASHARQEIREKLACAKATNASKRQTTGFCYMIGVQGYAE
jgi:hypothetical protein